MIAAVRADQDWAGFAVVMGILALTLLALIPISREWFDGNTDYLKRLANAAVEVDHETCVHDGCDMVLCYCRITAGPCAGTVDPGCQHPGEFVCSAHRLVECRGCRIDARDDARDDAWTWR